MLNEVKHLARMWGRSFVLRPDSLGYAQDDRRGAI